MDNEKADEIEVERWRDRVVLPFVLDADVVNGDVIAAVVRLLEGRVSGLAEKDKVYGELIAAIQSHCQVQCPDIKIDGTGYEVGAVFPSLPLISQAIGHWKDRVYELTGVSAALREAVRDLCESLCPGLDLEGLACMSVDAEFIVAEVDLAISHWKGKHDDLVAVNAIGVSDADSADTDTADPDCGFNHDIASAKDSVYYLVWMGGDVAITALCDANRGWKDARTGNRLQSVPLAYKSQNLPEG